MRHPVDGVEFAVNDEQGEDAVVRGDEQMAAAAGGKNRPARADPRVDHHDMDTPCGKETETGADGDRGGDHVPGRYAVGEVHHRGPRAAPEHGAAELARIGVLQAEIGGQGDDGWRTLFHETSPAGGWLW